MCETVQILPLLYKIILVTFCLFSWSALKALFQ